MRKWMKKIVKCLFMAAGVMTYSLQAEMPECDVEVQMIDMPMDQSNFAQKLSKANAGLFNQFNESQKRQAMDMTRPMNNKPGMTPDQAVEKVAKDNKMPMPFKKNPSGSCPVK